VPICSSADLPARPPSTPACLPAVEALGLGDAWVQAGSPKEHSYTWNSRINKYHGEGEGGQ
jgi:hypothetical protein